MCNFVHCEATIKSPVDNAEFTPPLLKAVVIYFRTFENYLFVIIFKTII